MLPAVPAGLALWWSEDRYALLALGVVLMTGVFCQLEDLKHPSTARRLLGNQIAKAWAGKRRLPSEEDALLFAAGRRVQRDWWAWLALFVPSFVGSGGAMVLTDWWTASRSPYGWPLFAAAAFCFVLAGSTSDAVLRHLLAGALAQPGG